MLSVTSDVSASATYQNAPPKPALPDPSQLASSFADLVDNSQPSDPSSLLPPAPEPTAPPPRSTSKATASDNNSARNSQASDQPPPSRADDSSNSAPPPANDANNAASTTDAPAKSDDGKSSTAKTSDGKSTDKTSTDKTSADNTQTSDANAQATTAGAQAVTQNPIAALITAPAAPANPQPTPAPANANGPLAIAAAAIAATNSTTAALTASPAPAKTNATASTATTDATILAKTETKVAPTAVTAAQPAGTDPATAADGALVTAASTSGAGTAKTTTGLKTGAATQTKGTMMTSGAQAGTSDPTATASNVDGTKAAQQPAVDAKPDQAGTLADAIKSDAGAAAPSTAAQSTHDHTAVAGNGQAAPIDPNAQLAALPQQLSNTAQVNATDKFTVTQATGAAVPLSGLAVEIAASVHSGKTQFEVRLDPADLGRIDVRIAVDRNGQVTSHLTVEKPETLSMLQQDAPQLQQALNDAGLKTNSGGLQFSLRDQSQSGQNGGTNQQSGGQPQRLVISEDDTVSAAVAGRSYGRMLGNNGGVDIRV